MTTEEVDERIKQVISDNSRAQRIVNKILNIREDLEE